MDSGQVSWYNVKSEERSKISYLIVLIVFVILVYVSYWLYTSSQMSQALGLMYPQPKTNDTILTEWFHEGNGAWKGAPFGPKLSSTISNSVFGVDIETTITRSFSQPGSREGGVSLPYIIWYPPPFRERALKEYFPFYLEHFVNTFYTQTDLHRRPGDSVIGGTAQNIVELTGKNTTWLVSLVGFKIWYIPRLAVYKGKLVKEIQSTCSEGTCTTNPELIKQDLETIIDVEGERAEFFLKTFGIDMDKYQGSAVFNETIHGDKYYLISLSNASCKKNEVQIELQNEGNIKFPKSSFLLVYSSAERYGYSRKVYNISLAPGGTRRLTFPTIYPPLSKGSYNLTVYFSHFTLLPNPKDYPFYWYVVRPDEDEIYLVTRCELS